MANRSAPNSNRIAARLRCAIYARKSSEEGLEQDFNSLDAQREACEAFIASQKREGWTLVGEMYDDGGFSGCRIAASSGLFALNREISVCAGLRGGAERTRTSNQTIIGR
jgi:hypothetical protein